MDIFSIGTTTLLITKNIQTAQIVKCLTVACAKKEKMDYIYRGYCKDHCFCNTGSCHIFEDWWGYIYFNFRKRETRFFFGGLGVGEHGCLKHCTGTLTGSLRKHIAVVYRFTATSMGSVSHSHFHFCFLLYKLYQNQTGRLQNCPSKPQK